MIKHVQMLTAFAFRRRGRAKRNIGVNKSVRRMSRGGDTQRRSGGG